MYLPTLEPALVYIMTYSLIFYYLYIIRYIIILYAHDDVLNTYICNNIIAVDYVSRARARVSVFVFDRIGII